MSDTIFITLSNFWLATILLLTKKEIIVFRFIFLFIFHLLILYSIFYIRHAGMIFPIMTFLIFFLRFKIKGLLVSPVIFILIFIVVEQARQRNKNTFEVETFSGFSGWLRANNALIIIPFIETPPESFARKSSERIHEFALKREKTIYNKDKIFQGGMMWTQESPLYDFFHEQKNENAKDDMVLWIQLGKTHKKYANELILKHPFLFLKKFIIPNVSRIFYHGGIKDYYRLATPYTRLQKFDEIKEWCKLKDKPSIPKNDIYLNYYTNQFFNQINIGKWIFIFCSLLLYFFYKNQIKYSKEQKIFITIIILFNILYLGMLSVIVPIIPRFLLVTYGSQMIFVYIIFSQLRIFSKGDNLK